MHDGSITGRSTQPIVEAVWREKYSEPEEKSIEDTFRRMAKGVCLKDQRFEEEALAALLSRRMVPAGRIHAGAGTDKNVTMINCFVSPDIQDSLRTERDRPGLGIMEALNVAAFTQQMGGGIGMDFSTLRPNGAIVRRTGSVATGPLHFMDMWNAMCATVRSSGSRRGAMMGTLRIDHPDILDFIIAKQTPGRLTNFNVSVLVTDAFMEALDKDEAWDLLSDQPRFDGRHVAEYNSLSLDRHMLYVYKRIRARELWEKITQNTFIFAEPGIIFIDRINTMNNLRYCEDIHCTNPCGEQPLPANGDCNLGHVNYAEMVRDPFTRSCTFDYDVLEKTTRTLVRFLDNVLDVSKFATEEQANEAMAKRRTGIGFTGLGTALQMMGIHYGSSTATTFAAQAARTLCHAAYDASVNLAKERGSFPLFDRKKFLGGEFIKRLPQKIRDGIKEHGIRNGVLLTVAPTGTTSIIAGNVSSGIEPVYALKAKRNVRQDDGTFKLYDPVWDYGFLAWCQWKGYPPEEAMVAHARERDFLPASLNCTIDDLTVEQHLAMQAAVQPFIDSSISKTINCPEDMKFEDFQQVYTTAYKLGLKGCTTYRFDARSGRGQVISKDTKKAAVEIPKPLAVDKVPMQDVLEGRRYRVKWPHAPAAFYVHINDYIDEHGVRRPFEIFINSKAAQYDEWMKAVTLLITGIFRRGGDVTFITEELKQVYSATGGAYMQGRYVKSLMELIALRIEEHFQWLGLLQKTDEPAPAMVIVKLDDRPGDICPQCNQPALVHVEGCTKCQNCDYSSC